MTTQRPIAVHREIVENVVSTFSSDLAEAAILLLGNDARQLSTILTATRRKPQVTIVENVASYFDEASHSSNRFDILIADRVLESLNDTDAEQLLKKILTDAKTNAIVVFREDLAGKHQRSLAQYTNFFDVYRCQLNGHETFEGFDFVFAKCLTTSVHSRQTWSDICWVLKKTTFNQTSDDQSLTFRDFLDKNQYKTEGIAAYEWIFGSGFISPGGPSENQKFIDLLNLKPGQRVLDVGCGIMGNLMQMAEEYGVHVTGADLSSNMINYGTNALNTTKNTMIDYIITDICRFDFPENSFDAIYSRDAIIHIPNKLNLFEKFYKWLKPGGKLLFTDYTVGANEFSTEFKQYLAKRQYALWTALQYEKALKDAGFSNATATDITERLFSIIQHELKSAEGNKESFSKKFSAEEFDQLVLGWKNKIGYIGDGDQKWAMMTASKPHAVTMTNGHS